MVKRSNVDEDIFADDRDDLPTGIEQEEVEGDTVQELEPTNVVVIIKKKRKTAKKKAAKKTTRKVAKKAVSRKRK